MKKTIRIKDQMTAEQIFFRELPFISCQDTSPIHLGFLSDTHNTFTNQNELRNILSENWEYGKTNFLIHGGDVVHKGGEIDEWEEFFSITSETFSLKPIISAIGNHEYQSLHLVQGPPPQTISTEDYH
ncbi:MAG: metallophosphoesterase [Bdellovibrio sp.]|nr:metallophosphoesterase [Bdellovibrio sp.]